MGFDCLVNTIRDYGINMGRASDYVYYLKVNDELLDDLIFSTEELAIEFAKESGYNNYEVIEWDVH